MDEVKKSPCVGICSTVYGDEVCKGCKRFYDEIIVWNSWDDTQKKAVYERLEALMDQAMADKLTINTPASLQAELTQHGIPYQHFKSHCWWLFLLWVKKPEALNNWQRLGITVNTAYENIPPTELLNQIDDAVNLKAQQLFNEKQKSS